MKHLYVLLLALMGIFSANGQTPYVIVKGTVNFTSGAPAVNWPVIIMTDTVTSTGGCNVYHTKYTNPNGYYIDTLFCTTPITGVLTYTQDCSGSYVSRRDTVPSSRTVVSNFTICTPGTATCAASFTTSVSGNTATFNSAASTGSSIVQRIWNFGDGTSLSGNTVQPTHTYVNAGTYIVRLSIITGNNQCSDSIVKSVVIANSLPATCQAVIRDSVIGNTVLFNAFQSTTGVGDSITSVIWSFGDSTSSTLFAPSHTYQAAGTYTVCLNIYSARGCFKSVCKSITISPSNPSCVAAFNATTSGRTIAFASGTSSTPAPDVIVRRLWNFGNGDTLGGNVVNVTKTYAQSGTYTVCLTIFTRNGCSKQICKTINVYDSCNASFQYSTTPGAVNNISFVNTSTSTSATGLFYNWSFGDSTTSTVANPTHQFPGPGTYHVCLTIYSNSGCQSAACKFVIVSGPQTSCNAVINYSPANPVAGAPVTFNSLSSTTSTADSIVSSVWSFGNVSGTGSVFSNTFTSPGTYNIYLIITSASGCRDTAVKTITVGAAQSCKAMFTHVDTLNVVRLYSGASYSAAGDSIISRTWSFGDGTGLSGNTVNPQHTYTQSGRYVVCLTIKTGSGCQNTTCDSVYVVVIQPANCNAVFKYVKVGTNTISFNSGASIGSSSTDSIVSRNWSFGDGSSLGGNIVAPVKTYQAFSAYNACLTITTASGCVKQTCMTIRVGDTTVSTIDTSKKVQIISVFPVPTTTQLTSLIWSKFTGVQADIAVVDIYGVTKWTTRKVLMAGVNSFVIPTGSLLAGPYTLRVRSIYGVQSVRFYKL